MGAAITLTLTAAISGGRAGGIIMPHALVRFHERNAPQAMGVTIPQKERTLTMGAAIIYCSGHWLRGISDLVSLVRRCAPWYLALGCNFHSLVSVGGLVGRWTTTPAWPTSMAPQATQTHYFL